MGRVRRALRWLVWDGLFLLEAVRVRLVSYVEDVKVLVGTLANMALTIAGYVVLWSVLTGNVESLRGAYAEWGLGGLLVLVGFSELAFALDALITYGVALIPSIIHEEGLETYSIHPVGTLAEILGKHSEPIDGFTGLLLSTGLIAGSALAYDVPVSPLGLALGVGLLLLGLAGLTGLYLALASLSFRYGMLEAPVDFVTTVYVSFSRVPHDIFPRPVLWALTFVLPVALLSTWPTLLLQGAVPLGRALLLVALALTGSGALVALGALAWRWGRASYQPAGG